MTREDEVLAKLAAFDDRGQMQPFANEQSRNSQLEDMPLDLSPQLTVEEQDEVLEKIVETIDAEDFAFIACEDDDTVFIVRDLDGRKLCEVWRMPEKMHGTWQIVSPWDSATYTHDELLNHLRENTQKTLDSDEPCL